MELPPLALVPPTRWRTDMMPEEWELCLDSWLFLVQKYLMLPTIAFNIAATESSSLPLFLASYIKHSIPAVDAKATRLRKECFLLIHRVMKNVRPIPSPLLEWEFLTDLSLVYSKSRALLMLLENTWDQILDASPSIGADKNSLIKDLEANATKPEVEERLLKTLALLRACYKYGQFLMLGSDLIDSLSSAYDRIQPSLQKKMVTITYFSLMSLMGSDPKISTLLDHLYSIKTTPLLKTLIGTTPFLQKMRAHISGQEAGRARSLIDSLVAFEKTPNGRQKRPVRRKVDKGKGRATDGYGHGTLGNAHVHKLSLVSQVQDLFPDLGSAFIIKLLDEYDDNTALVTDHLLNDSLPVHLSQADRTEQLPFRPSHQNHDLAPHLAPHSTPPLLPSRRNIHDDDDFDRLAIDASKLRLGKNKEVTADELLGSQRSTGQKAAILSALAAFDSDDDERDDTYDVEDVGGTVDNTNDDNAADLRQEMHEEALFSAYNMSPDAFNRDAETRRGKARAALKSETGMTDEAVEGWAIMIGRDPRKLKRLEAKFETAGVRQNALQGTAWRGDSGTDGTEDSDVGGASRGGRGGRGGGGGRGREQARAGGGGGVAGEAGDKGTQVARQRQDANKGSRANHNRRDQRARKMARDGFPG